MPLPPEPIAILAVGVTLAGIVLQRQRGVGACMDRLEAEMQEVRNRRSRLEGKMHFVEACIVGRNERPAAQAEQSGDGGRRARKAGSWPGPPLKPLTWSRIGLMLFCYRAN